MNKQQHSGQKENSHAAKCVDCPFFISFRNETVNTLTVLQIKKETKYPFFQNNFLSDYHPHRWKPPDTVLL